MIFRKSQKVSNEDIHMLRDNDHFPLGRGGDHIPWHSKQPAWTKGLNTFQIAITRSICSNWASYSNFCESRWGEISFSQNFEISLKFWNFWPIIFMWAQFVNRSNSYIATWGSWFPPPLGVGQNRYPLGGTRIKENL